MTPRPVAVPVGPAPERPLSPGPAEWRRALAEAVVGRGVSTVYQPIVDLDRGVVTGYEALARFSHPDIDAGPDRWFAAAAELGQAAELDAAALRAALAARADLPPNTFLSVNVEPASLLERAVRDALASSGPLGGVVVVEITEHRTVPVAALEPVLDRLRGDGALIAVDDAGAGYSGLSRILDLRPSILKLDHSLVHGIDTDEAKAAMVEMLGVFAGRIDAWVLAEGIETRAELQRVADLGVPLGQGYLLGRPAPPWSDVPAEARECLLRDEPRDEPLRSLLQVVPMVRLGIDDVAAALAADGVGCVLAIDDDLRPVGIVTPEAAVTGQVLPALRVGLATEPAELAHRLGTTGGDPSVPAMVTDPSGRAVGVVTLRRLLTALARQSD